MAIEMKLEKRRWKSSGVGDEELEKYAVDSKERVVAVACCGLSLHNP